METYNNELKVKNSNCSVNPSTIKKLDNPKKKKEKLYKETIKTDILVYTTIMMLKCADKVGFEPTI